MSSGLRNRLYVGVSILALSSAALLGGCMDAGDDAADPVGDVGTTQEALDGSLILCSSNASVIETTFSSSATSTLAAPPNLLHKADIVYSPGEELYVNLHVRACVGVAGVAVNGLPVATSDGGIDSPDTTYTVVSNTSDGSSGRWIKLKLAYPNLHTGNTSRWRISTYTAFSKVPGVLEFRLATVSAVGSATSGAPPPATSLADSELRNAIVTSTWKRFGVLGQDNSSPFSNLRDPDYEHLSLTAGGGGVALSLGYHLDITHECRPLATISGVIRPKVVDGDLRFDWAQGPSADVPFDLSCTFSTDFWRSYLGQYVAEFIDGQLDEQKHAIEDGFQAQLDCGDLPCQAVLSGVSTGGNELRVSLKGDLISESAAVDSVSVLVPYRSASSNTGVGGIAIPEGDHVAMFSTGIARACKALTHLPGSCSSVAVGPDGLFNSEIPYEANRRGGWPIPDPSSCSNGTCGTNLDQLHARQRLIGVTRPNTTVPAYAIPFPDDPIGSVVFTRNGSAGSQLFRHAVPCTVESQPGRDQLYFGVNDRLLDGAEQGTGSRVVTLVWTLLPEGC